MLAIMHGIVLAGMLAIIFAITDPSSVAVAGSKMYSGASVVENAASLKLYSNRALEMNYKMEEWDTQLFVTNTVSIKEFQVSSLPLPLSVKQDSARHGISHDIPEPPPNVFLAAEHTQSDKDSQNIFSKIVTPEQNSLVRFRCAICSNTV